MSYGNYNLPGVGSNSYSSYSYSSSNQPKAPATSYSDPFAKPSGSNFGLGGNSFGSNFGTSFSTPNYGGFSSGFGTGAGGFGNTGGSYGTPGGYGAGGYGGYSAPSNTQPAASTTSYGFSSNPSTSNYGASTGGYGGYGATTNYGTTTPSYGGAGAGAGASTGSNYGGSYGGNYSYGGAGTNPSTSATTQPQQASFSKPSVAIPAQVTVGEINDLSKAGKQLFSNAFAKSSTKSAYQDLLRQLQASGQKYKDLDFPPELRSLTGGLSEYELAASGNPLNWRSLVWLRAEEIYGKGNFKVFQGDIEPNDVDQGALGDCYFLSTLASLAESPDRIRKIFESDTPNEQGCYAIKICDTGVWQTIIMDDYLPCSAKSKQPCFTKGNGNEIWVQLLEKAWAKVYGSYARIEAGLTRECLHDLTGAPTKYYLTGDPAKYEEIWKAIATGEKKNYAMTCGAGDFFEGSDLMSSIGLVGSHAYSLLAAVEVTDRYGKKVRLVKLRNPWGKGEWTGDWSDESPTWTEELKRQLQLQDKDDGIFYMSYQDMLKYFSDIQICKIHDDFKYKALKANCDSRHAVYFKLTVRVPGHYFITINQESKRKHAEKEDYKYSEVYLVMGKKTNNGYEYIEGYQKADKEVWTDGHLDAGEYIVYSKIAWNDKRGKDFAISSYGQGEVDIEQVPKTYCGDFIDKVYLNKGRQAKKLEDYQHCGVTNCYRTVELTDDGFGFVYYRNESNKTLEEEIYFKFLEGLKLRKPYRGNSFKMVVPPGQERIVITKVIPNAARIRQAFTEKSRFV